MRLSAFLCCALCLYGCTAAPPPAPEPTQTPSATPTKARPLDNLVTEAGKAVFRTRKGKPWLMEAMKVRYDDSNRKAELDDVDWTLTGLKGEKLIRIKASKARYRMEEEQVEFVGEAQAWRFPTHDSLKAGRLVWNGKTGALQALDGVTWTRGQTIVRGDRALTNDKLERITVEGNVRVTSALEGDLF